MPIENKEDWPRERLERLGAGALSDKEIIAILLRTGYKGKSVMELAEELTNNGRLYNELIHMTTVKEFQQIKGLGGQKSTAILAAIELGRRLAKKLANTKKNIETPEDVYKMLAPDLRDAVEEHFYLIAVNNRSGVLGVKEISKGTLDWTAVHPREIYKQAILFNASKIIVVHNHPSGDIKPSMDDRKITKQLKDAGNIIGIPLLDHIIIGGDNFYSFCDNNTL